MIKKSILVFSLIFIVFMVSWEVFWFFSGVSYASPFQQPVGHYVEQQRVYVDVRTELEYDLFHIPGAIHMPELVLHPSHLPIHLAGKELVIVCLTGHRSQPVAYHLSTYSGVNASSLSFGMLGWMLSGSPVE